MQHASNTSGRLMGWSSSKVVVVLVQSCSLQSWIYDCTTKSWETINTGPSVAKPDPSGSRVKVALCHTYVVLCMHCATPSAKHNRLPRRLQLERAIPQAIFKQQRMLVHNYNVLPMYGEQD